MMHYNDAGCTYTIMNTMHNNDAGYLWPLMMHSNDAQHITYPSEIPRITDSITMVIMHDNDA